MALAVSCARNPTFRGSAALSVTDPITPVLLMFRATKVVEVEKCLKPTEHTGGFLGAVRGVVRKRCDRSQHRR